MRICVVGTANIGKTTFINDFLENWPGYSKPEKTYRDTLPEGAHSKHTTAETQEKILDFMVSQHAEYGKDANVIFDRCPLDNMAYTLWGMEQGLEGIDFEFADASCRRVSEAMRNIDLIFYLPICAQNNVKIVEDGVRETDPEYIKAIDDKFREFHKEWATNAKSPFFPSDDRPAILEIFGNRRERIEIAKLYLDPDGNAIEPDQASLFDEESLKQVSQVERMIELDRDQAAKEKKRRQVYT